MASTAFTEASEELLDSHEGVKREMVTVGAAVVQKEFWNSLFLGWDRLRRIVAWLIRVFYRPVHPKSEVEGSKSLKTEGKFSPVLLSVSEVTEAEKRIIKFVQKRSFPVKVDKSVIAGQLARLKPFEVEGILRVGGRLNHSDLQYDANISTE